MSPAVRVEVTDGVIRDAIIQEEHLGKEQCKNRLGAPMKIRGPASVRLDVYVVFDKQQRQETRPVVYL